MENCHTKFVPIKILSLLVLLQYNCRGVRVRVRGGLGFSIDKCPGGTYLEGGKIYRNRTMSSE